MAMNSVPHLDSTTATITLSDGTTKPALERQKVTSGAAHAVLVDSSGNERSFNKAYTISALGAHSAELTINNSSVESGWLDVSMISLETLSLLIDASTSTGTITVDIDVSEDAAGLTAIGYTAAAIQSAGITTSKILKLSALTNYAYAHFIKIKITETATANYIFHAVLMGREI